MAAKKRKPTPKAPPVAPKADAIGQPAAPVPEEETDGLSPLELRFIDMSASGRLGMEEMAVELGCTSRTLRRWKRRPEVAKQIRDRTTESMALARAVLSAAAVRAARELEALCTEATPDGSRVAACKTVLEAAVNLGQVEDLSAALAEVEARLGPAGRRRP